MVRLAQISGTLLVTVVIVFLISAVVEANPIANPASVDFGLVPLNTQITQPIDITVDAGYKVSIASGGLNDPFSFSFGTCPDGGNCTVNESFLPTSIGSFSDTLNLFECPDAGGNCLSVGIPLLGAGVVETNPVPEPTSLLLLGSGLLGLAGYGRKKFFNKK